MNEQRTISQVDEQEHNQAMLTFAAERRELILTRNRAVGLEQLARQQATALEQANVRIAQLEVDLVEAEAVKKQPEVVPKQKGGKP